MRKAVGGFAVLLLLIWSMVSLLPRNQSSGSRSTVVHSSIPDSSSSSSSSSSAYGRGYGGGEGEDDMDAVASIWRTRPQSLQLACDPQRDYFSVLQGHNWDSWMARREGHSVAESYEPRPSQGATGPAAWWPWSQASSQSDLRPRVPCNPYWRTGPSACSKGFEGALRRALMDESRPPPPSMMSARRWGDSTYYGDDHGKRPVDDDSGGSPNIYYGSDEHSSRLPPSPSSPSASSPFSHPSYRRRLQQAFPHAYLFGESRSGGGGDEEEGVRPVGPPALHNQTLLSVCDAVLDNGYERGRAVPRALSRLEAFPHLQAGGSTAGYRAAAGSLRGGEEGGEAAGSPLPFSYPLSRGEAGDWRARQLTTLELLDLVADGLRGSPPLTKGGFSMNRFAVNLGANDGATSDPVAVLYRNGWRGVAVELEDQFCGRLRANILGGGGGGGGRGNNVTVHCPVAATPLNTPSMLEGAPVDLDYLKIDIDSYDCDVLAAVLAAGYRPKVVQMETGTIPPPVRFSSHYHPRYGRPHAQIYQAFGCSLAYADDLLNSLGATQPPPRGAAKEPAYTLLEASLDSIWVRTDVLRHARGATAAFKDKETPLMQPFRRFTESGEELETPPSRPESLLVSYVNGFWRWPWRRELHVWEIGTEHWFQLRSDRHRLRALADHMGCVASCFHDPQASPFRYTLQNEPLGTEHFSAILDGFRTTNHPHNGHSGRQIS